ncbi:hypothetical protein PHYSODRAFT_338169 [Phytophthora sojae]|uniref:Uncharacterized protein n=1 Tax=Phytophthora sojae (strain P6497) TaxID=1094619 RepID=G5A3C8_PHYSP|nr:hypothetical protein PHYSODRAFT_338169 [Phytophthora sojae]EGZ09353.1 hypothetical protein PHYSODRAFT_338169 [Phytophthora sojae]|eukprot:XP_009534214.1 hypothetical protein PHYSODRAFT_338169 [Phytophthora sojae]
MALPSRAFADAAAAALPALQCSGPGAVDVATDTSGSRPARQARSARATTPIAAGAVPPAPAMPAGDPELLPAASETSVDPPPAPLSSPESGAGATETPPPAVRIEEAPDSPPTPPPSASAPPSPTPAPSGHVGNSRGVGGVGGGGEAAVGGRAGAGAGTAEIPPSAVVLGEQQMLELARLVVGVARLPPARVIPARNLQAATNVGEVLAAAVPPVRLPLAKSDELVDRRRDNDRLREELVETQDKLDEEMRLRQRADYLLVTANSDCNQALEHLQDMRAELANSNQQLLEANAAISQHANITQSLDRRTQTAEADAAAAVRRNAQLHERIKASLVTYNTQLQKLRDQLSDRDRADVIPARIRALTDESNSLRRANSILRRHSAAHGLDVDTLVLASAGISAAEIDWNLLGLSPPTVTVESPRRDKSSSEQESKTADVSMAEPTEGSSAPAASEVASVGSSESTGTFKRKRDSQAESAPPRARHLSLLRPSFSVDRRSTRAAAAAGLSSPRSASGEVLAPPPSAPRPSTTFQTSRLDSQPLPYEHSDFLSQLGLRLRGTRGLPTSGSAALEVQMTSLEAGGTSSEAPATTTESLPAIPVPEAASIVSQGLSASRSSTSAPLTRAAAGPGGLLPPGDSPEGGSSDSSETSEDRAALMQEMFGSDVEAEASAAQHTGPAAPPESQATTTEAPAAPQAASAALLHRHYTRSTSVHAHALVTATVTATPRAGPVFIAPAVVAPFLL